MQQLEQQELETRGFTSQEQQELVRRAEQIRIEREGRVSRDLLTESAAEVGVREEDLREAERQLQAEKQARVQRAARNRLIAGITAAVLALFLFFSYNGLNGQRLAAVQARSNLQATFQRRADVVPQLAKLTREGAAREAELAERLAAAQAGLRSNDLAAQTQANAELNRILAESSPQLRSTPLYQDLMAEVAGSENRINVARQRYNEAATRYNGAASSFPTNLARPLFGFPKELPLFEARGNVETPPAL